MMRFRNNRKKQSFIRVWTGAAVPLLVFGTMLLFLGTRLVLVSLIGRSISIAENVADGVADMLESDMYTYDDGRFVEEGILNMEGFQMAAVLFDPAGKQAASSATKVYRSYNSVDISTYEDMISRIKERGAEGDRCVENNFYKDSYLYDSLGVTIDNEEYVLQYAALMTPWKQYGGAITMCWCIAIFFLILLSLWIAYNFYRIYRARLAWEQQRRDTTNAIAHDLKTPLMAISGYAENLGLDIHTEKKNYYTASILKNVDEMNEMIESMLELAKVERAGIALKKEKINLRTMTEGILESYQSVINKKRLLIEVEGESLITADRALMKRVLENLIGNAVKYTPPEQNIYIGLTAEHYCIKNTGVEIPAGELEGLWKPYKKAEVSRGSGSGAGIGLSIVKEILEAHLFRGVLNSENNCVTVCIYFCR